MMPVFRKDDTPGFFQSHDTAQQAPSLGKQFCRHAQAYNRCGDTGYPRDTAWHVIDNLKDDVGRIGYIPAGKVPVEIEDGF